LALLNKWNRAYNLTAVRDPLAMIERHLIDSLALLPYLRGRRILDLGTGAGLPGIPLAICSPRRRFVLLDANNKKIRFVRQVVLELALENVQAVHQRVEAYQPPRPFDLILSRAFAPMGRMLQLADHLLGEGTTLLAMKGRFAAQELAEIPASYDVQLINTRAAVTEGSGQLLSVARSEGPLRPGIGAAGDRLETP